LTALELLHSATFPPNRRELTPSRAIAARLGTRRKSKVAMAFSVAHHPRKIRVMRLSADSSYDDAGRNSDDLPHVSRSKLRKAIISAVLRHQEKFSYLYGLPIVEFGAWLIAADVLDLVRANQSNNSEGNHGKCNELR
jgi:hypothetical protein